MNLRLDRLRARQNTLWLALLIAIYVIAVAVLAGFRTAPFVGSETDGVYYMIAARKLFTKEFIPPTFGGGIGMPLAIAAVNKIIPDTFRSAQIVSMLAGLIYLISVARVLTRLTSTTVGISTGCLLLVSPIFLLNSTTSLTDVLGACLPLAAMSVLLSDRQWPRWSISLIAGLLFGAAYAVRSINLVFVPILIAGSSVTSNGVRKNLKALIPAALGLFVGALPQLYVNQKYFGNAFHSDNWRNIAALVLDWHYVNRLTSFSEVLVQAGPVLFFLWVKRFLIDIPVALYHVAYLPFLFSIPGFVVIHRKAMGREKRLLLVWGVCAVVYLLFVAPVWRIESRYFLPVLPLVLSAGVVMWRQLTEKHYGAAMAGLGLAILMSLTVAVRDGRQMLRNQSTDFKDAGLFLRQTAADNELILASQPSVFLYAQRSGMMFETFSPDDLKRLDETVASNHVNWIVFDERRGAPDNPELGWLLDKNSAEAAKLGWRTVFESQKSPKILVWRVN